MLGSRRNKISGETYNIEENQQNQKLVLSHRTEALLSVSHRGHRKPDRKTRQGRCQKGNASVSFSPEPRCRNPNQDISRSSPEIHKRGTQQDPVGLTPGPKAFPRREINVLQHLDPERGKSYSPPTSRCQGSIYQIQHPLVIEKTNSQKTRIRKKLP